MRAKTEDGHLRLVGKDAAETLDLVYVFRIHDRLRILYPQAATVYGGCAIFLGQTGSVQKLA
jgi:hypothetical protein